LRQKPVDICKEFALVGVGRAPIYEKKKDLWVSFIFSPFCGDTPQRPVYLSCYLKIEMLFLPNYGETQENGAVRRLPTRLRDFCEQ
jgi:hypothetical protein